MVSWHCKDIRRPPHRGTRGGATASRRMVTPGDGAELLSGFGAKRTTPRRGGWAGAADVFSTAATDVIGGSLVVRTAVEPDAVGWCRVVFGESLSARSS